MSQNRWAIGELYGGGLMNGQPFYKQVGGPGTKVIPTQQNGPWSAWPAQGSVPIVEYLPIWAPGCGHADSFWKIVREFDYNTNQSCALVLCSQCGYCQQSIEPFELWLNPNQYAIIVG